MSQTILLIVFVIGTYFFLTPAFVLFCVMLGIFIARFIEGNNK